MTKTKNRLMSCLLLAVMLVSLMASTVLVSANTTAWGTEAGNSDPAYTELISTCLSGTYVYASANKVINVASNRYKMSGGGYILYVDLWKDTGDLLNLKGGSSAYDDGLFQPDFERLTMGSKQAFLKDVFTVANAYADDTAKLGMSGDKYPTDDTVADMMVVIQNQSGLGSAMLATLLQNTKPNYVSANRLYQPFSGVVGTGLGIISVLIMAALGLTMALDLAYITIPAFQMAMGGTNEQGHGDKSKGIGNVISQEAKKAVQAADGGQGGQAGSGEYKAAVGIYFKYRWKGLVLLAICLLYLVQGQIYSFVGWFIDLFSGFLGF